MIVSHNAGTTLYMQVYNYILQQIEADVYRVGEKIPSQERIAEACGVSVVTARKALEQLAKDEIIVTKHGMGSFVAHRRFPQQVVAGGSFTDVCHKLGCTPETRILSKTRRNADNKLSSVLGVSVGAEILRIERLRLMDGQACILERDYFPDEWFSLESEQLEDRSLLGILAKSLGTSQFLFDEFFDVTYASSEESRYLDCKASFPLLRVSQIVRIKEAKGSRILYYNEQIIRSDRYRYAVSSSANEK